MDAAAAEEGGAPLRTRHIKKRALRNKSLSVSFDEKDLKDFVGGFHKRKKKRRKEALQQQEEAGRRKRIELRKKRKMEKEFVMSGGAPTDSGAAIAKSVEELEREEDSEPVASVSVGATSGGRRGVWQSKKKENEEDFGRRFKGEKRRQRFWDFQAPLKKSVGPPRRSPLDGMKLNEAVSRSVKLVFNASEQRLNSPEVNSYLIVRRYMLLVKILMGKTITLKVESSNTIDNIKTKIHVDPMKNKIQLLGFCYAPEQLVQ